MDEQSAGSEIKPAQLVTLDPILPTAMARRAEETGVKRVTAEPLTFFILSVLAGAFIAFGAIFSTTVTAGSIVMSASDSSPAGSASLPYGLIRLLSGVAFSLGFILVVIGGAELFTGNNLIVMAWAGGKVRTRDLLKSWALAFAGNSVGAFLTAILAFYSTQYTFGSGAVGLAALATAHAKSSLAFIPALTLGILCNALVCLAAWMCYSARTSIDRIFTVIPPIAAFVAAGFEHSIANVYFIAIGLFIKTGAPDSFWTAIGKTTADFPNLTWSNFLIGNLIPVTLGNVIGGSILVAAVYWFIYLRKKLPD
jgi:formate/nitrite transporter